MVTPRRNSCTSVFFFLGSGLGLGNSVHASLSHHHSLSHLDPLTNLRTILPEQCYYGICFMFGVRAVSISGAAGYHIRTTIANVGNTQRKSIVSGNQISFVSLAAKIL
jgi:hypothetical protein